MNFGEEIHYEEVIEVIVRPHSTFSTTDANVSIKQSWISEH